MILFAFHVVLLNLLGENFSKSGHKSGSPTRFDHDFVLNLNNIMFFYHVDIHLANLRVLLLWCYLFVTTSL